MGDSKLDKGSFDFFEVISGMAYPKDTVEICLAADTAYEISKLYAETKTLDKDGQDKIDKTIKKLEKALDEQTYILHVTGIGGELIDELGVLAKKEYPDPKGSGIDPLKYGATLEDRKFYHETLIIQHQIERIVRKSDGAVSESSYESALALRKNAPESQWDKFNEARNALNVKSAYFEKSISEDF